MSGATVARWRSCFLAAVMGCAPGNAFADQGMGAREIEASMQEYARLQRAKDAPGLAAFYTPDGELLEPGMDALKGPEAIRKFLESFGEVRIESASMATERIDVWDADAVQWGSYAQRIALPGTPPAEYRGRFVAQWSRRPGGRWLIRRLLTQPS